jgi:hypothetical protein
MKVMIKLATAVAAMAIGVTALYAQEVPPPENLSNDQSHALNAVIYLAPPKGFDPVTASDVDLEAYGLPPRPDPSAPREYETWMRMMSKPHIRLASPLLRQTTIEHGPARNVSAGASVSDTTNYWGSDNWSGYVISGANGTFKQNNSTVWTEYEVPTAQQAFGSCDGTWWYSSQWVGMDGFRTSDVLQAGTNADAYCELGKSTLYDVWYEWYPYPQVTVTNFRVTPGDWVFVEVWYTKSAPQGHMFFLDETEQLATSIGFNPPPGTTLVGNSAEWIMERPTVNGSLPNLTNYFADVFSSNGAQPSSGVDYYPGTSVPGPTTYSVLMTCFPWSPSTSCSDSAPVISSSALLGTYALYFFNAAPSK